MECSYKNHSHCKNISKEKIRRHSFVVYVLIYPLSKFGGNRTNSLWVLAFYSVLFKWKNWLEKTALNMSIRRVIFASSQNLKAPFLCQYLIFFTDFFFYIRDLIWIITLTKNRNLKKIVDLKVYCNLALRYNKWISHLLCQRQRYYNLMGNRKLPKLG